ncbi:MAG: hypothetical protein CMLOHMNK_01194 [Steroidobacteraceae bacterium]|nr:hypothetical protein [Steroidobacteraceae bacterium]
MARTHYDPRTFSPPESVGYLLKLSHALMLDAATAAFDGHDLGFMQWLVLLRIREGVGTVSGLCQALRHDTGALTRLVDQLERRRYVARRRSTADRRVVELQLTAAGRRKTTELMPLVTAVHNAALADFSAAEFKRLKQQLRKLIANLRAMEQARRAAP